MRAQDSTTAKAVAKISKFEPDAFAATPAPGCSARTADADRPPDTVLGARSPVRVDTESGGGSSRLRCLLRPRAELAFFPTSTLVEIAESGSALIDAEDASFLRFQATPDRAAARLGDKLVCQARIRAARVFGQDVVCSLAALPFANDEEVPRVIEVLDQDVPEVAGEVRHFPPDCVCDLSSPLAVLGREARLPDREHRHDVPPS